MKSRNAALGTLEAGKAGHVVVVEGELFDKKGRIVETWVDGRRYEVSTAPSSDVRGTWIVSLGKDKGNERFEVKLAGEPGKLTGSLLKGDKETKLTAVSLNQSQLNATFKGEALGWDGVLRLTATVSLDGEDADNWLGTLVFADGRLYLFSERGVVGLAEATPDGYREHGRFQIRAGSLPTWSHPVVSGGRLYLRDQDTIYAYSVKAGS